MTTIGTLLGSEHGLYSLNDHLVELVSHHDSVLIDQAVWDALGSESWAIRRQVAFDTSYRMLETITKSLGLENPEPTLDLASELFTALGLGQLHFDVSARGGNVTGTDLLFGSGFLERYGKLTIRHRMDAFAAGYVAAASTLAYPSDWGSFEADEVTCIARGDAGCAFSLARRPTSVSNGAGVTRLDANALVGPNEDERPVFDELAHDEAQALLLGSQTEGAGVIRLRDCRLGFLPVNYRAELVFSTLHLLEKRSPNLASTFFSLIRESVQAAAYLTIADLDRSPALAKLDRPTNPEERAMRYAGLASACGWGLFSVREFIPERHLVLAAPVTPEAVYYTSRLGGAPGVEMPCFQGVSSAIALLAQSEHVGVRFDDYSAIARSSLPMRAVETRSIVRGDAECEVVISFLKR